MPTQPGPDLGQIDELLTDAERQVRDRVRDFCHHKVLPRINYYWERGELPAGLPAALAQLGLAGGSVASDSDPPLTRVADGLVAAELARADGSVRDFQNVHDMVMAVIATSGSEEQRERWLPAMRRIEKIGAFALTEPEHGSDASNLETRANNDGPDYVLRGRKRWITNGTVADVVLVWARDSEGNVGGYIVEPPTEGFVTRTMARKTAMRAVPHAEIDLDGVQVPADNRLPGITGFRDVAQLLAASRTLVAWEALGHAIGSYEIAVKHAGRREQFGRPLGSFQLVQANLAEMAIDVTAAQLMCWRASTLGQQGTLTDAMAATTKAHATAAARRVVAAAREILGGDGLLLENHVARHMADMEAVFTYEGTYDINRLIVGRHITGHSAFA